MIHAERVVSSCCYWFVVCARTSTLLNVEYLHLIYSSSKTQQTRTPSDTHQTNGK